MSNPQEEFWRGEFGNEYGRRNRVDWRKRISFWRDILRMLDAYPLVLEVGCSAGWNLLAIQEANPNAIAHGIDINTQACDEAKEAGLTVTELPASAVGSFSGINDLVFTAGVLIHIPPDQLRAVMEGIIKASRKYVLAVEYASANEVEVNYRGHAERLWKRPFGTLYEDLGLRRVLEGKAPAEAFDQCHYWLMRK